EPWVVMLLPPGGFLVLGAWLLLFEWMKQRKERAELEAAAETR
ncbi:MAG: electron transport complex subunit RsxE, partial [gamma proteobacterium symbiont of Ctena orbiculata]